MQFNILVWTAGEDANWLLRRLLEAGKCSGPHGALEKKGQEDEHTEIEYLKPGDSSEDCFKGRLGGSIIYHEHQEWAGERGTNITTFSDGSCLGARANRSYHRACCSVSKDDDSTLQCRGWMVVLYCQKSGGHGYQSNQQTLGSSQGTLTSSELWRFLSSLDVSKQRPCPGPQALEYLPGNFLKSPSGAYE